MSKKVTYAEIIEALSSETGFSKTKTEAFSKALIQRVLSELQENGKASITNFGSFKVKDVAERQGKNPQTGDPITIPAHKRVSFTPYKALKEEVNEEYAHLESELIPEEQEEKTTTQQEEKISSFTFDASDKSEVDEKEEAPFDILDKESGAEPEPDMEDEMEDDVDPFKEVEPSKPFDFDAADDMEEEEDEEKPEPKPFKAPRREHQRDKSNYGIVLLAILTVVIVAIASAWFFVSTDSNDEQVAEQVNNPQLNMAENNSNPENTIPSATQTEQTTADNEVNPGETQQANTAQSGQRVLNEDLIEQYQVKENEWYWVIAEKVYGESGYWPLIFEKNETLNDDPDQLYPSIGLTIPGMEGSPGNLTKSDYTRLASAFRMVSEAYSNLGKTDKAYQYERNSLRWARLAKEK